MRAHNVNSMFMVHVMSMIRRFLKSYSVKTFFSHLPTSFDSWPWPDRLLTNFVHGVLPATKPRLYSSFPYIGRETKLQVTRISVKIESYICLIAKSARSHTQKDVLFAFAGAHVLQF